LYLTVNYTANFPLATLNYLFMKYQRYLYYLLVVFVLNGYGLRARAQGTNPCGVVASIWPAAADSVVPANTIISFSSTSTNATSVNWLLDGYSVGITATSWNYQITTGLHTLSLVAYNGTCTDTTTVVYFSAGTPHNVDSLLLANYGTYMYNEEGTCIDKTVDGGYIAGGVQYLWGAACGEAGILVKMRDKGCIDWSKKFLSPYFCNNSKITALHASADTNYYVATANIELARLDKNGNLVWNKRYKFNDQGPIGIPNVYGDPLGAVYTISQAYNNGWMITKLDKNGAVTWNKFYRLSYDEPGGPAQSEFAIPSGMVWLNGKIYVCGNAYSKVNFTYFSFITKLDAITGAKEWQYGYTDPELPGAMGFTHLALYDTLLMASSGGQGQMVTLIDQQGLVRKSIKTKFGSSYGPKVSRAGADSNGHIYMMQWTEQPLPLQPYYWYATNFAEIDTSLNKYWGMVFAQYPRGYFADATMGGDNKFAAIGQDWGFVTDGIFASRDFKFLKVDTVTSEQFCFDNGNDYDIAEKTINRLNFQYHIDSSLTITPDLAMPYTVVDAFLGSRYTCPDYVDSCSFMKISGSVNLCSLSDTYTYRMHRNKKCTLSPQWKLPAGVTIVNQTDSTLSVQFSAFGVYNLSATLNSCIPVKDSLIINIASKSHPLHIGADTTICQGTSITLHAANDFFSYEWSNGSTDSVLNVTQPGLYWVQVKDSCNNTLRDSITITPFNLPINIGADRTKCNTDTVHLNGPAGFLNYTWYNNYNINTTNAQNVIVNPLVDTAYYLKAEKLPGCFAYDTVRINVKTSLPIQLGADKSFCNGDSAILNAGGGFATYVWSNGSTAQQSTVYTAGNYSVIGTAANNCTSYDTLRITNIWPSPVVNLNHDQNLCTGTTRTLQAGNFSSYVWQNGSTLPSFTVIGTGTYYVTVTDSHQCRGSDTTKIIRLLPVPANFLPADTAICSYGEITLLAKQTYTSYLWSNGKTAASITITQPGLYWMQATDQNSCRGTDSVKVLLKECMKGLYVPTAFTPNGDTKNDFFKPLIFGSVVQFECRIYDRYGQIIFTSTNPFTGWDGTIKGVPQNSGTYVWVCRYRFAGEKEQVKNGSVVLLR
jgi:gliding motility-associated-like protein